MGAFKDVFSELFRPQPCYKCAKEKKSCGIPLGLDVLYRKSKAGSSKGTRRHCFFRPYFTLWTMWVDTAVLVVALCTYSFAPIGTTYKAISTAIVRHNLAYEHVTYSQQENFWIGPDYEDLIHFGAKYSPCMRHDQQVEGAIAADVLVEAESGCCVRNDLNVCWQAQEINCTSAFATFHNSTVCGIGKEFCAAGTVNESLWDGPITDWPNCPVINRTTISQTDAPTKACEVTAKPCCIGLQGQCAILSEEECSLRQGYFHSDKSLCAQVDCIHSICGIDVNGGCIQFYRFLLPTFIHCGVIHLIASLLVLWFIVRPMEMSIGWLRCSLVYLCSGMGSSLTSAFLTPYQPEVGSSGSLFGIIGCYIARDIISLEEWRQDWRSIWDAYSTKKLFVWLGLCVLLLIPGLLPWIDNLGHIGGLIFGFLTGFVVLPSPVDRCEGDYIMRLLIRISVGVITVLLATAMVYMFYEVQNLGIHVGWINCIPFTDDFCADSCMELRPRIKT